MIIHLGFFGVLKNPILQYFITIIYIVYTFYIRYNVMGFFDFQIFPNISMQWKIPIYIQLIITSYANKLIFQCIFGVFSISKYFHFTPSGSASNIFCKKKYAVKLFTKKRFSLHYALCTFFGKFWEPFL